MGLPVGDERFTSLTDLHAFPARSRRPARNRQHREMNDPDDAITGMLMCSGGNPSRAYALVVRAARSLASTPSGVIFPRRDCPPPNHRQTASIYNLRFTAV